MSRSAVLTYCHQPTSNPVRSLLFLAFFVGIFGILGRTVLNFGLYEFQGWLPPISGGAATVHRWAEFWLVHWHWDAFALFGIAAFAKLIRPGMSNGPLIALGILEITGLVTEQLEVLIASVANALKWIKLDSYLTSNVGIPGLAQYPVYQIISHGTLPLLILVFLRDRSAKRAGKPPIFMFWLLGLYALDMTILRGINYGFWPRFVHDTFSGLAFSLPGIDALINFIRFTVECLSYPILLIGPLVYAVTKSKQTAVIRIWAAMMLSSILLEYLWAIAMVFAAYLGMTTPRFHVHSDVHGALEWTAILIGAIFRESALPLTVLIIFRPLYSGPIKGDASGSVENP